MTTKKRDYIFLTLYKNTRRIAIGLQKGCPSILYTYNLEEGDFGENYYSYTCYRDALSENEAQHIADLVSANKIVSAQDYITKHADTIDRYGPCEADYLSEIVPDEWFAEAKKVINYLGMLNVNGILTIEYEEKAYCF